MDRGAWQDVSCHVTMPGIAESDMTEWLSTTHGETKTMLYLTCKYILKGYYESDIPLLIKQTKERSCKQSY